MADGAALAVGDVHLLAVAHIFALDLVAQHLAVVAHADATRLRLPDVAVGVHLAVGRAALFITWWRRGGVLMLARASPFPLFVWFVWCKYGSFTSSHESLSSTKASNCAPVLQNVFVGLSDHTAASL